MNKAVRIILGVGIAGILGFVAWKYFMPPTLTIRSYNANDDSGTFEFGACNGALGAVGCDAGWGWSVEFAPAATDKSGWVASIKKDGVVKKTQPFNGTGMF